MLSPFLCVIAGNETAALLLLNLGVARRAKLHLTCT